MFYVVSGEDLFDVFLGSSVSVLMALNSYQDFRAQIPPLQKPADMT